MLFGISLLQEDLRYLKESEMAKITGMSVITLRVDRM
jgi:hypothetical protein